MKDLHMAGTASSHREGPPGNKKKSGAAAAQEPVDPPVQVQLSPQVFVSCMHQAHSALLKCACCLAVLFLELTSLLTMWCIDSHIGCRSKKQRRVIGKLWQRGRACRSSAKRHSKSYKQPRSVAKCMLVPQQPLTTYI